MKDAITFGDDLRFWFLRHLFERSLCQFLPRLIITIQQGESKLSIKVGEPLNQSR